MYKYIHTYLHTYIYTCFILQAAHVGGGARKGEEDGGSSDGSRTKRRGRWNVENENYPPTVNRDAFAASWEEMSQMHTETNTQAADSSPIYPQYYVPRTSLSQLADVTVYTYIDI